MKPDQSSNNRPANFSDTDVWRQCFSICTAIVCKEQQITLMTHALTQNNTPIL